MESALSQFHVVNRPLRVGLGLGAVAASALIMGCAGFSEIKAGTPLDQVIGAYGNPSVTCQQPDGTRRMVWTQQPAGETAWAVRVTADNKASAPEQVLTQKHFGVLESGVWTSEKIRCEFGPPAKISEGGFAEKKQTIWSYHFMQPGGFYAVMYVYMGKDGDQMTQFNAAPDPSRSPEAMGH